MAGSMTKHHKICTVVMDTAQQTGLHFINHYLACGQRAGIGPVASGLGDVDPGGQVCPKTGQKFFLQA